MNSPPERIEPQPVTTLAIGPYNPNFEVDGLAVGGYIYPDSAVYKSYTCRPSVDFAGFTWCSTHHAAMGKFGPYTSWVTILHSSANKVAFITEAITPAFFQPGDVDREIQRLSRGFGQAQILNADPRPDVPHAVLAAWGAVTLTPLDEAAMDALRNGEQIHRGLIAEFIGDAHKSARIGLPVYSIGGGPGYLWGANFDDAGKGSLRISAVDASALTPPPQTAPVAAVAPSPSTPSPEIVPALPPPESGHVACSALTDPAQRLACYDKATGAPTAAQVPSPAVPPPAPSITAEAPGAPAPPNSVTSAPAAPTPPPPSCQDDWRFCTDNAQMANEYSGWIPAQNSCERTADKMAEYGTPQWPHSWMPNFNFFHAGRDYQKTGKAVLIEHDAQFQNMFSAMVHSTVTCTYNLDTKTVIDVSITPN